MIGKAKKFAVIPLGRTLFEADINAALKSCFGFDFIVKEINNLAERQDVEVKQQPSIPIQFVWRDGELYRYEDFLTIVGLETTVQGCTVEQIGAVLYVRAE